MRRITAGLFQSLDGVVQAPGGPEEDPSGGFAWGGWIVNLFDEETGAFMDKMFAGPPDLLLGRTTYDIFAAHWPRSNEEPIAGRINAATKYVMTSSTDDLGWRNVQPVRSITELAEIKSGEGPDILVQGSSTLYPRLLEEGLVDRLFLITFPVILGRGKRALGDAPAGTFRLVEHSVGGKGAIVAVYEPSGPVVPGSFAEP